MPTYPRVRVLRGLLLLVVWAAFPGGRACAQVPAGADSALPAPRLLTVFPPGGKVGSAVEVTFGGVDLEEPEKMVFSHPGIKAEAVVPPAPPADPKKPVPPPPKPPVTKFKVTVAADVPVGSYDCRLVSKYGVTNPRVFVVGDLSEVLEKEPNNEIESAQRVELNSTINGNLANPTDVDYYVFAGKKGQHVVFSCLASTIDSRLAAGLEVYDARGKYLAGNRNYHDNDALTDLVLPDDGNYFVRVFEFTYTQGSAEHFYRLSISTAPWIDAVFPSVVEPGKPAQLTVYGRNLPGGVADPTAVIDGSVLEKLAVTVNVPADPAALERISFGSHVPAKRCALNGFEFRLPGPSGASNAFLLTYARAPVVLDNGANDSLETAQPISVPCEIAGRIEKRHDRDWYVFNAKKGETYEIVVQSNRLGAPTYMYYRWGRMPEAGKPASFTESQDDGEFLANKFHSGADDPAPIRFTADADGKYVFMFASHSGDSAADPRHLYCVRITPLHPDFHLIAMPYASLRPEATVLHAGGSAGFTVFAVRHDGFTGQIQLAVEGLPPGVTYVPQTLGSTLKETTLVLSADAGATSFAGEIKIKGTAAINGQAVVHEARPGGIVWPLAGPAPLPVLGRLERGLWLAVRGQAPYKLTAQADKPALAQGDKGTLTVNLTRLWPEFKTPLTVQAFPAELPAGLTFNNNAVVTIAPAAATATLPIVVAPTTPPGTYNIVLRTTSQIPFNKDPKAAQKPPTNVVLPSTPLALTVLPKSLATVTLANGGPTIKLGQSGEVVVRVTRQFDYADEYKVQLVLPDAVKDVSAAEAVIPPGQNEAKLVLKVAAGGAAGARANLVARVTALYEGKSPIVHEVKFNLNVVK